jgi:5'-methylthioadenosine phosphorylase
MVKIGIIGGSGFDDPALLKNVERRKQHTPYGSTSDLVTLGSFKGTDVVIIPRHGQGHTILPSRVNYRANVWAMKELGVTHLIATTAVGSLREEIEPGHLVLPDQFIDRTTQRKSTFFEGHEVYHIAMAEPFCPRLRGMLRKAARELALTCHERGTVVTIEGPRFSTRAESNMFRMWGADVINMSTVPEVVLAREAGICYAAIAMSTDYDCWHESEAPVTWEIIAATMRKNVENAKRLLFAAIPKVGDEPCECGEAIKAARV